MAKIVTLKDDSGEIIYPISAGELKLVMSKTDIGVGADLPENTLYGVYE